MKNINLSNIANVVHGELKNLDKCSDTSKEASCVVIDSRLIEKDGIFIATVGEKVDGHSFVNGVSSKGALGAIVEHDVECDMPYIVVEDSFQALKDIARFYREQLTIPVIGITGSVGKTSTKEFVAGTLSAKYNVLKTQGNFNNEVGMPLTILSIRDEHEVAVIEMGISDFDEMTRLTEISKPDACIITNIGQCHLENLHDRDGVLRAKTEIFKSLNHDGAVFLNGDDDKLRTVKAPWNREITYFGLGKDNDIYATDIEDRGLLGTKMRINCKEDYIEVDVPQPGIHMVVNSLVAAGVGLEFGLTYEEIKRGIASVKPVKGRSNVIKTEDYIVLDDCYNANPVSMKAAIDLLGLSHGRKVAILGDMFELGENENELHREVGEYASSSVDVLIAIGKLSKNMPGAIYFETKEEAIGSLKDILKKGDSILIKASHGMHFEELVSILTNEDNK